MMFSKRNAYIALASLAVIAIFAPGPDDSAVRQLDQADEAKTARRLGNTTSPYHYDDNEFEYRAMQSSPTPPPAVAVNCAPGQQEWKVSWEADKFEAFTKEQFVTLSNGMQVMVKNYDTGDSLTDQYSVLDTSGGQAIVFGTKTLIVQDAIIPAGGEPPFYPVDYGTMEIDFPETIDNLYISVGDVDSTSKVSDCTRIRMFDSKGDQIPLTFATTGTIKNIGDYAFESQPSKATSNPGYESSLYARANGAVRKILIDQSSLAFDGQNMLGKTSRRGVFPALDFVYCADTPAPTPVPSPPTDAPVTSAPVTSAPVPVANPKGVNGDPLIMGLGGELFKFDGRNGAWYSYASAPSFQWNMKVNKFEGCPKESDKFTTGFGLSLYDPNNGQPTHKIEVNVVNEHSTGTGCGFESHKPNDYGCLGAGSLEIIVDGSKITQSVDYEFEDKSGHIIAYNTIASCSRRWFDFDMTPADQIGAVAYRGRRLSGQNGAGVFDILDNIKDTTVDRSQCETWMAERKTNGDIFQQAGTWSTIVIKTEKISFHVEYKQEQERCDAHNLDVWISEVTPEVGAETWEGIVGETKPMNYKQDAHFGTTHVSRVDALKYPNDEDYEVIAPFSVDCKGCMQRQSL